MSKEVLKVEKLCSVAKGDFVYKDINISINEGEIVGLLGHNGAGKSTLLRNIGNLEKPQSGKVFICLKENDNNQLNTDVVLVPDTIQLFEKLTVEENLKLFSQNYGYDKEYFETYLRKVKLKNTDSVGQLSKGNQEILQLIIMFSLNSKLLLLDEPFSAVDIFRRDLIVEMIIDVNERANKTIIITTHLIAEIEQVLERVIYIDGNKIEFDKKIDDIQMESETLVEYLKERFKGERNGIM